jgi:integrase
MGALITDRDLTKKPGDKDQWFADDAPKGHGRFCARITPSGERLFYFRYTNERGKREYILVGAYDSKGKKGLTLEHARKAAGHLRDLYLGEMGTDGKRKGGIKNLREHLEQQRRIEAEERRAYESRLEAERREAERQAAIAAARITTGQLFARWVNLELAKRKESSRKELVRAFEKDVLPVIGDVPAEEVTRAHVMAVLDNILVRGARRLANRTLSEMRQMFGFGYVRGLVQADPTHRIKKADVGGKETERERALSEDEIRELAKKLPAANLYPPSECAIWIMLSTGCRVGDLMKAQWSEFDDKARTWTFEPEKDQEHIVRTHTVYLSDFAWSQFERLRAFSGTSRWLYPNSKGGGFVCKKSITKQIGDRQTDKPLRNRTALSDSLQLSGGRWTPHDLRRTCSTRMVDLGISESVADRCIYHLEANRIRRIYNRAQQKEEQARAWVVLGERLDLLTRDDADNVVVLARRTA